MLKNVDWPCQICEEMRENARISVRTIKVYMAGVPVDMNIRYCNDRAECWAGTEDFYRPRGAEQKPTMESSKTIPETLADLRKLFAKHSIEDWEPIPSDQDRSYSVRYRWAGQWLTVSSTIQVTKDLNLRQCHQVIRYLLMWAERGVGGISQGVTFIHGGLAKVDGAQQPEIELHEAYATIGVDPAASIEEIHQVYRAKAKFSHPDTTQDAEEKLIREARSSRLNIAYDLVCKVRGVKVGSDGS